LYPGARVIYTRRNPVDTCWSCYRQAFGNGLSHTTDLTVLGTYFRDVERLMAFWRSTLPLRFLEVRYEDLVQAPEPQMRRLVAFTGLEWDARCLDFAASKRRVVTASRGQADQPLYTHGIGNSAPYHRYLGELFTALGLQQPEAQE